MKLFFWNLKLLISGLVVRLQRKSQPVLVIIANSPPATGKSTLLAPEGQSLQVLRETFWSLNFLSLDNEVISLTPQQRHLYSAATGYDYDSAEQRRVINLPGALQLHLAAKSVAVQASLVWPTVVIVQVPTQNLAPAANGFCLGDKLRSDYKPLDVRFFHMVLENSERLDQIVQDRLTSRGTSEHQQYIDSTKLGPGWYTTQAETIRASANWDNSVPVELPLTASVTEASRTISASLMQIILGWR